MSTTMNPHDLEALQTFFALHDSPENQALPEAERLPMIAGWERNDRGVWERPVYIHTDDLEYKHWYSVYPEQPDPIDLQAASGVLAGWLGGLGVMTSYVEEFDYWASTYSTTTPAIARTIDELDDYPTLLAAQVAAAGAVLGVEG